ncbi:hypothetical protein HPB51_019141 [Rhipicephalus microplus]|uniref:HTH CENPB-type domain-containing protein n=1 Tax=Rhipicephalus microplus TaxID=6941 RepID=A0A9J6EI19_RHIMP|nr:hypothetical protein HPB51_019141 [Rhipicephalus microplus]
MEKAVFEYVKDMRKDGCAVSLEMVRTQVRTVSQRLGLATKDFRASSSWTTRFMRRNALLLRRRTSLCQRLPSAYEDKVIDFHRFNCICIINILITKFGAGIRCARRAMPAELGYEPFPIAA